MKKYVHNGLLADSGSIQKRHCLCNAQASENSPWLASTLLNINHLNVFRCQNIGMQSVVIYATLRILISYLF